MRSVVEEGPVSALVASPAASGSRLSDPVRALQHALYRAAKADPGRRFHALRDKVLRGDVLWRAWVNVRRNDGAAGIDRTTLAMVEQYGVTQLLDELEAELTAGAYRRCPPGGCSSQSRAATSAGRCRFLRSATGSCRPQ
jgi:RNA-directed DNA polymerase